ncbi:hypothetical protein ABIE78_002712 [Sinorhizobium fredii]|uniref:Uncharacterized protein n=1 Tax=Sinorhizobium fredii (strain USDA 257) TaxID=1185652 RepID=I3X6F0_SINF2|nr:hypothetical protein USDA257_c28850 [Sinorhizobium fredii USDA 257]
MATSIFRKLKINLGFRRRPPKKAGSTICLFGTSNGVVKNGYADVFSKSRYDVRHFKNFSLGACTSSYVFYYADKVDFSKIDFCILDLCVNDGRWIENKQVSPDTWTKVLRDFCSRVMSAGCLPIILILPSPDFVASSPTIRSLATDVSRELQVPFFDGYDVLAKSLDIGGTKHERFFRDSIHVHEWFGQEIAKLIVADLPRIRRERLSPGRTQQISVSRHELVTIASPQGGESVERGTSLIKERFVPIRSEDAETNIPVPTGSQAVSVCIDLMSSNGYLELVGDIAALQKVTSSYYSPQWSESPRALLAFRPVEKEIQALGRCNNNPRNSWQSREATCRRKCFSSNDARTRGKKARNQNRRADNVFGGSRHGVTDSIQ